MEWSDVVHFWNTVPPTEQLLTVIAVFTVFLLLITKD